MLTKVTFGTILALCASTLSAQSASLRGRVTDQTGAIVPGATVTVNGPEGLVRSAAGGSDGMYAFPGLPLGDYTVSASAPQLTQPQPAAIVLRGGAQVLDLKLQVASTAQQVVVSESSGPGVSTDPSNNAGALDLRGDDLQALSDDPDDLAEDLQALAGPSAGPNGGQLYVDGFTGGQLPPKESIREVRINSNPFSPEYDYLGYGRIEILTKPGVGNWHGSVFHNFGDDSWNSRNPYAAEKAPFLLLETGANLSGPLNKRTSFTLDIQRHAIDNGAIINGSIVDPQSLAIIDPYTDVFRVPQRRWLVTPRVDYQLNANNTLTVRYQLTRAEITDSNVGGFNLVSQAYDIWTPGQILQVTESRVIGTSTINETRFQFVRFSNTITPALSGPAIQVMGSFNGGAAPIGNSSDLQTSYELQNYTTIARGRHSWRFGVRLRGATDDNVSRQNFSGTFAFGGGVGISSIEQYQLTLQLERAGLPPAEIRAMGGGAAQFSIAGGEPQVSAGQFDVGVFVGDDWKVRRNLTVSPGLRYEAQTNIHHWWDFAPRLGVAWAPGGGSNNQPKTVIRAGFGLFYNRFALANTITAERYNGVVQQQYIVTNPDFFPTLPPIGLLNAVASASATWEVSSRMRAPYTIQSSLGLERQLPGHTTLALTYTNSHGLHLLRSDNINAPLAGTYDPSVPHSGVYPYGSASPIFLMESAGLYNQNQFVVNVNSRFNQKVSLFGSYVLNQALSNTDGLGTFPANPHSIEGEYGSATSDIRNRVNFGGSIDMRWGFRISPLLTANSGIPYNITVGHDLYGDTLFTARPGIATDPNKPGVIATSYGLLDPNPVPGEPTLSRNFGRGPGIYMFNVNVRKTFAFGPPRETGAKSGSAPPERRYTFSVAMSVRNILNHNNPGPIVGNIASPRFGQANQPYGVGTLGGTGFSESANNRRLELQVRFAF